MGIPRDDSESFQTLMKKYLENYARTDTHIRTTSLTAHRTAWINSIRGAENFDKQAKKSADDDDDDNGDRNIGMTMMTATANIFRILFRKRTFHLSALCTFGL